jgi:SAM-dependent methyltransferase
MRSCPACGGDKAKELGEVNRIELARCSRCGTVFTGALPGDGLEAEDYGAYYDEGNLEIPAFVEGRLGALVDGFEEFRRLNCWLDVGCGAGGLLRAAAGRGWSVVGTEVAPEAVEAGRARGLDVRLGGLGELELQPESFDVVSAVEVLEHVPHPQALISDAARLVRPGGGIYFTTPNGRGISARLLGTRWSVVSPPEHLQLFSVDGLRRSLGAAGLDVASVRCHAVNPRELLGAFRRRDRHGEVNRVETGYRLNEALSESRSGRWMKGTANAVLSATRLGDSLKVTARKPA